MFDFLFKKKKNNIETNRAINESEDKPRQVVSSVDELKRMNEEIKKELLLDYKLPDIEIVSDNCLKSFIADNQKNKNLMIPIGFENDTLYIEDLESMPNLIIGGTVMSGKSSFVHTIIGTILMCEKPFETKLLIVDSKKIEYNQYNKVPHMLSPVLSDQLKCKYALNIICNEIEDRLNLLKKSSFKTIMQYNNSIDDISKRIPRYVVIIDSYDMFCLDQSISNSLKYIADNGWNANVFLIVVSNHPSSQIISSIIKSSIPARMCFRVPSAQDSIAVLDSPGANKLNKLGDALYTSRLTELKKVNVKIIEENDIIKIIDEVVKEQKAEYDERFINEKKMRAAISHDDDDDDLYNDVVEFVIKSGKASSSLLQRRFKIGYDRACRLVDLLEERGIIGPQNGSKPREVLVKLDGSGSDY